MAQHANETIRQQQPKEEKAVKARQRRPHSRSRTGCSECRSRRVRCGEQRPTCQNCVKSKRVCDYPPAKIPLRERRALERAGAAQPWEHTPWEVSKDLRRPELPNAEALAHQLVLSGSTKTFSCVAIDMPLKSQELFHYFYQTGFIFGVSPKDHTKDCLAYIISDPEALRSAVLMAGTHFAFNCGSLQAFEPTFLFHKIETMRMVKEWISRGDHKLVAAITKQVATLAYTEICRGDLLLAETHLNVIYAISNRAKDKETSKRRTLDQELSDRYFLLTSIFIHGLKTILTGILRSEGLNEDMMGLSSSDFLRIIHTWYATEGRYSQHLKLKALRMFPAFFNPPHSEAQLVDVDIAPIVQCFRELTEGYYGDPTKPSAKSQYVLQDEFWKQGSASEVYETLIMAHLNSISYGNDNEAESSSGQKPKLKASWCGLVITAQLYMEQVVRLWRPFKKEIYLYTMRVFQRDLSFALQKPEAPQIAELLFWESFTGLMSIYAHEKKGELDQEPDFKPFFERITREQSRALELHTWADARAVLSSIAWPSMYFADHYIKGIWERTMVEESVSDSGWC